MVLAKFLHKDFSQILLQIGLLRIQVRSEHYLQIWFNISINLPIYQSFGSLSKWQVLFITIICIICNLDAILVDDGLYYQVPRTGGSDNRSKQVLGWGEGLGVTHLSHRHSVSNVYLQKLNIDPIVN